MLIHLKTVLYKAVLLSLALGLLAFTIVLAASGDLDTTFSGDGWVITDVNAANPGRAEVADAMAIQSNGKIVVVGSSYIDPALTSDFALARYNPNGPLDVTFSGDGKLITNLGGADAARAVAIQSNGKIVVVGDKCNSTGLCQIAVVRYNANGSLDTTFNTTGKKLISFMGGTSSSGGLAIQPNGKIVVGAFAWNGSDYDFAVFRLNANGSLDTTFSSDGKVTTDISNSYLININTASAAKLETLPGIGPTIAQSIIDYRNEHGPFARIEDIINVSGIGPGTFNIIKDLITVGNDYGVAVAIQLDGKIVVAGHSSGNFALVRYKDDGSLDTTFSGDGRQKTNFGADEYGFDLALQSDGKIVLVGAKTTTTNAYFALARYNTNGSLDTTFNGTGRKVTNIPGSPSESPRSIVIQSDGKIVVGGWADTNNGDFALVRYNSNGSLDTTFSGDGIATFDFSSQNNFARPIALDSNGKYVLAGFTDDGAQRDFALARVLP